jgi:hypothetical protein
MILSLGALRGVTLQPCGFSSPDCLHIFHCRAKTEFWHIAIEHFELIWFDQVGFVPDSHNAIRAYSLVELLPCFQMGLRRLARKLLQLFK